jgi:arsenite-transporting ATPase
VASLQVESSGPEAVVSLPLPLADRADVDLARTGDDLVVTVGGQRRVVALPEWLAGRPVTGATLADGRLSVHFGPPADTPVAAVGGAG